MTDDIEILPRYQGTMMHDAFGTYPNYTEAIHALCHAHHLRDLKSFIEQGPTWAMRMTTFLFAAKQAVEVHHGALPNEERIFVKQQARSSLSCAEAGVGSAKYVCLLPAALFILFPAAAWTRVVAADFWLFPAVWNVFRQRRILQQRLKMAVSLIGERLPFF